MFAAEHARLALIDTDAPALTRITQELPDVETLAICADVSDPQAVQHAVDATIARFGSIDVVVANAGQELLETVPGTSDAQWDRILAVNLSGTFYVCRACLPHLRRPGGAIVTVSSVSGYSGRARHAAYGAAKAGVIGLTKAMALDHAPEGIRVNCVVPGITDTPMGRRALAPTMDIDNYAAAAGYALGRAARAEEVAAAILFMASDDASFVSGETLLVDGGRQAS
jgi:NAD(P)-dependent dehydrogenase (short-subunit alcohol dehydrogenase family)